MDKVDKTFLRESYTEQFGRAAGMTKLLAIYAIIDAFDADVEMKSLRWLAYILGTSMHESNDTFQPVKEGYYIKPESRRVGALYNYYAKNNPGALRTIFPNGRNGTAYYGRGRVVQLTHDVNYERASLELYGDLRLLEDPDMIINDVKCDMAVTFRGMREGWFTGQKLGTYFPLGSQKANWVGARRIINGLDKARLIAGYAEKFYECLRYQDEAEAHKAENENEELPQGELAEFVRPGEDLESYA